MQTQTKTRATDWQTLSPSEFGKTIDSYWSVADALIKEVVDQVERENVTPLEGLKLVSAITKSIYSLSTPWESQMSWQQGSQR